jgi:signal transduction histidine kinase
VTEPAAKTDLERRVAQLEADQRSTGDLIDFVAHELLTPVTSLGSFAYILGQEGNAAKTQSGARCLEGITRNAARLASIVDEMLEIGRLQVGRTEVDRTSLDARDLAKADTLRATVSEIGAKLETDVDARPLPVKGDKQRLAQALSEMVRDAAARSAAAGTAVALAVKSANGRVRVEVRDRAPPQPPGKVEKGFTGQRRTADAVPAGTRGGLGLALAGEIVKRCGGVYGGESSPEGNLLWFELPPA